MHSTNWEREGKTKIAWIFTIIRFVEKRWLPSPSARIKLRPELSVQVGTWACHFRVHHSSGSGPHEIQYPTWPAHMELPREHFVLLT